MEELTLLSGRTLAVYPIAGAVAGTDELELDTSGKYLSLSGQQTEPVPTGDDKELRRPFVENAHFLLAHAEEILSDSRMFLAPVLGIESGLAYSGTSGFRNPTLGVYIEWWLTCEQSHGRKQRLVFRIAGSPLSSSNKCSLVDRNGKVKEQSLTNFSKVWRSFMEINQHYTPFKGTCQAYSIEEVVSLLRQI